MTRRPSIDALTSWCGTGDTAVAWFGPLARERGLNTSGDLPSVDELPPDLRTHAAVVDASDCGDPEGLNLFLGRLRDVHADRIAVIGGPLEAAELRALGFEASADMPGVFVADPGLNDQPREWNNARHWANPQNFDRYRW